MARAPTDLNLPQPPTPPPDDECCHRGCDPCIFDYYDRAVERWETIVRARGLDPREVMAALAAKARAIGQ